MTKVSTTTIFESDNHEIDFYDEASTANRKSLKHARKFPDNRAMNELIILISSKSTPERENMMAECELLVKCAFFKKFSESYEAACRGLVAQYCRGPKQNECKRKEYRLKNATPPPDNMLPAGHLFKG
jgi:hypothetical protein